MGKELEFEANDQTIGKVLFQDSIFKIPRYQRPYAWGEDQINEFWNDLNEDGESFFLGSFIFNHESLHEEKYIEIVDGQQRILTITIFAAMLRDIAKQIDPGLADYYHRNMIVLEHAYQKWSPRIICGESTQDFFGKYILNNQNDILNSIPTTYEEKLIKNNYKYFYDKVIREFNDLDTNEKKKNLLERYKSKIEELIVIYIKIDREEDAYEIFETTNARGVDLNVADLLKNWIFKNIKAAGLKDIAKELWKDIEVNVQTDMRRFLRYHWISANPFTTERKLYKTIKKKVVNWDSFLDELWQSSDIYNLLIEAPEEEWINTNYLHPERLYKSIKALRLMGISQCYVLLLCILRNYKKLDLDPVKIFETIEKFSFIYSAICKLPSNKVEKLYNNFAQQLEKIVNLEDGNKKINVKVQQLFAKLINDLRSERPPFDFFVKAFMEVKYKGSDSSRLLLKYILSEINNVDEKTKEHKIDFSNVNIEHVIPQTPDSSWELTKDDIKDYVNQLGNLTLVDKVINSKVGNKSLKEKIKLLGDSQLPITQKIIMEIENNGMIWDKKSIITRQTDFAGLAYKSIWDF